MPQLLLPLHQQQRLQGYTQCPRTGPGRRGGVLQPKTKDKEKLPKLPKKEAAEEDVELWKKEERDGQAIPKISIFCIKAWA